MKKTNKKRSDDKKIIAYAQKRLNEMRLEVASKVTGQYSVIYPYGVVK